jgi:hypothetical protein
MLPRPRSPRSAAESKQRDELRALKKQRVALDKKIARAESAVLAATVAREAEKLLPESETRLARRMELREMWVPLPVTNPHNDYERCGLRAHDCWYGGNMDRLDGLKLYRLKGYDRFIICDVCLDNGRAKDDCDDIISECGGFVEPEPRFPRNATVCHTLTAVEREQFGRVWFCAFGDSCAYRGVFDAHREWCQEVYVDAWPDARTIVCDECVYLNARSINV